MLPGALRHLSLRRRLGVAAFTALVTAATLGTLLLVTAGSARSVAEDARHTHTRLQHYSSLISALRSFQVSSYSAAQIDSPHTHQELQQARTEFRQALDASLQLPQRNEAERALDLLVVRQGEAVITHLAGIPDILVQINEVWRTQGPEAAGTAAQASAAPVRELEALLDARSREDVMLMDVATSRVLALNRRALMACIIGLLLAAAFWAIIHGSLLRRLGPGLQRLEEGTRAFASGNLDHRVHLGGKDELARLGAAFDTMAELLADKQHALRQVQVGLEAAVRERTEDLEQANRELAASDGRRRAFLADIGHELRTPLTIIRGEAQVALRNLEQPESGVEDALDALERIVKYTRDLGRMVDDLFLIARAEAGGLPMQIQQVELRELTRSVADDYASLASDLGATVEAADGPPVYWHLDPDRLRRALAALVDNALRHTRQGVQVTLAAEALAGGVAISVSDDGPGIDPMLVPELFQRFRRGHTQGEGTGLGLSVVRALVEAQSGRVQIGNRPGGGARAVLLFGQADPTTQGES